MTSQMYRRMHYCSYSMPSSSSSPGSNHQLVTPSPASPMFAKILYPTFSNRSRSSSSFDLAGSGSSPLAALASKRRVVGIFGVGRTGCHSM